MEQDMQSNGYGNNRWKDKLEQAAGFTGNELLDTNAAWDKLYNRLRQPKRKRAIGYWAAAASILTGIVFAILFSQQQQTKAGDTVNVIPPSQVKELLNTTRDNDKTIAVETGSKKKPVLKKQTNKIIIQKLDGMAGKKEIELITAKEEKTTAVSIYSLPAETALLEEAASATALVPRQPKAKLKVVHVNELGNADDNTNRLAVDYGVIQFGVTNQQAYNKSPLPSGKIGLNISTGKTSPSN